MSLRLHRLLPALALVALVLALPPATASATGTTATVQTDEQPTRGEGRPTRKKRVSIGERAAKIALEAVGIPYRWGGASPTSGFDCSGLVLWAYGLVGIEVPHSSYALWSTLRGVERSSMAAGDVLVFSGIGHVGLYLGGGRMVHAPSTGRHVEVVELASSNYGSRLVGVRRVAPA